MDDDRTVESLAPADAPAAVARAWVEAVMDERDLRRGWALMDPSLRLVLVQHWIWSHQGEELVGPPEGWDALAGALAACPSDHPLWERFARERLRRWREFWAGFSLRTWELLEDEPEVIGEDLVVVTFVERSWKWRAVRPGPPPRFRRFAIRRAPEGWVVAGLDGSALFRPGWPPSPA